MATIYAEFFRSIPTLVQLFFVDFGITFIFSLDLSPFAAATIALGLEGSALMSEVVRSGLQSVGKGQMEAARASGSERLASEPLRSLASGHPGDDTSGSQHLRVDIKGILAGVSHRLRRTDQGGHADQGVDRGGMLILFAVAAIYIVVNYAISLVGSLLERRFSYAH